jgi:hypothetical protein
VLKRDETTAAHIEFLSMRKDPKRSDVDVAVVTVIPLIVIRMIYLFAPPTRDGPMPTTATDGSNFDRGEAGRLDRRKESAQ